MHEGGAWGLHEGALEVLFVCFASRVFWNKLEGGWDRWDGMGMGHGPRAERMCTWTGGGLDALALLRDGNGMGR